MSNEQEYNKYEFYRNMRRTPWQKLFPHWWAENDLLTKAIGEEVERIKALAIFALLNAGIKPPVMTWKESIVHKKYHLTSEITQLSSFITIQAPLYKTWGLITLANYTTDDIENLQIMITQTDGILIKQNIKQDDIIVFNLLQQELTINEKLARFETIGDGIPYFKTVQNKEEYDEDTPLHNEVIRMQFLSKKNEECNIHVDVQLDNVVFTDEQNIEITGLELVPIDRIDIYAKYDFEYNPEYNGWHKVFQKVYDRTTNVLYDMITTQIYTDEWYVEVFFKGLEYPYKVGFPCYRDAPKDSMYHVNERLDSWGELLGLDRRQYRTDITEEEYASTFPVYYPYDIEQDYWYFKRLTNEYAWNHLAINDVELKDTEGNNLVRLHSINPFIEDFVVHAKSTYPKDKVFQDYNTYIPLIVSEQNSKRNNQQSSYTNIKNLLSYNNKETTVTLNSRTGSNINNLTYQSKELWTFFDLTDLPEDVSIDNIEILVEGSSTDNKTDKYSNNDTGLIIPELYEDGITFIPLYADKSYQLSNQVITYSSNDLNKYLQELQNHTDEHIKHTSIIGPFQQDIGKELIIPLECHENDEKITDITDVWVYFGDVMVAGEYKVDKGVGEVHVTIPKTSATTITLIVKSKTHKPITVTIDIGRSSKNQYALDKDGNYIMEEVNIKDSEGKYILDENGEPVKEQIKKIIKTQEYIYGPLNEGKPRILSITEEWHTKDVRNIIQKNGIYFRNIFENDNEQSQTTINIKNITLKISYSDKKSTFKITTNINHNVKSPKIAEYSVNIKNTGNKALKTYIDVINAPNISMSNNFFEINLDIGQETTKYSDIYAEYPIDDGHYDILTVCEDFTKKDIISLSTVGMIETGVKLLPQHAKYTEESTITAEIITADNGIINSSNVEFYINNYYINGTVNVENNIATLTFTPQDYKFINSGLQTLEVKFGGTEKYSNSRASNEIFIRKEGTIIDIEADENATFLGTYTITTTVYYKDSNGNKIPVTDGIVTFYANNILLGKSDLLGRIDSIDGIFSLPIGELDLTPGEYTLWARYGDSDIYASNEESKNIRVYGGETNIHVFDIEASPVDTINIRAKITDSLLEPINVGEAKIHVYYEDIEGVHTICEMNEPIHNGLVDCEYDLKQYNFGTYTNDTIDAIIEVTFGDTVIHQSTNEEPEEHIKKNGFIKNTQQGSLKISRKDVRIEILETFQCTQYEPLGFLVRVIDINTNQPIKNDEGIVTISIPRQTIAGSTKIIEESAKIDSDGYARIICNPMASVEAWDTTGKFNFVLGTDYPYLVKDGEFINIYEQYPQELSMMLDAGESFRDLYIVTDVEHPENFFRIDPETGILHYTNNDEIEHINEHTDNDETDNIENYFYIDPNSKELYRKTSSKVRLYKTGNYNVRIVYNNSPEYKTQSQLYEKALSINTSDVDLDLHTYSLDYGKEHHIICYADANYDINGDNVAFYIDDEKFLTTNINNNQAIIPYSKLSEIKYGNHLIKAVYDSGEDKTYTYALLSLSKITPSFKVEVEPQMKNQISKVNLTINNIAEKPISGFVNLYLDGELINYQYLYGDEGYYGVIDEEYNINDIAIEGYDNTVTISFDVMMPDDIDIVEHYIELEYEGNELIDSYRSEKYIIHQKPLVTELNIPKTYMAYGQDNLIDIEVHTATGDYVINEGYIEMREYESSSSSGFIVSQSPVYNNKATLTFKPNENIVYSIQYIGTQTYLDSELIDISDIENIILIAPQPYIYVSKKHLDNVFVCESLRDAIQCIQPSQGIIEIHDEECIIDTNLTINKPLTIIGQYNTNIDIQKDLIISNEVLFDNLVIQSTTGNKIINKNKLKITHSILKNNLSIVSVDDLTINRCLVYCNINATKNDLNNNWWGKNQPSYPVDNNIILQIEANETPAVICDNINIVAKMIGANGREYDIPEAYFTLSADSGYFSVDSGQMINHTVETTYFDATKEGKIYLTVDDEKIDYTIYDYDRKTEIIIDPITDIPSGHYVTLTANVYSVTDSYDKYSNIKGYVEFYFDDKKIGRSEITNNKAQVSLYVNPTIEIGPHKLKTKYIPTEKYFSSSQKCDINVINTNNVYYVSPTMGSDESSGNFDTPFKTIQHAVDSIINTENGAKIFLKDGEYAEANINIDKNLTIQSYNHNVIFKNIDNDEESDIEQQCIFNITANKVNINKINFINNQIDNLINTQTRTTIEQSLLQGNKSITEYENISIKYSTVLDQPLGNANWYEQCWFGTNEKLQGVTNQVLMDTEQSKDYLYKGIVATITGTINQYKNNDGECQDVDKPLPLRIAEFSSKEASLQPLEDYTYNNHATSLLNTNLESNSNEYKIILLNNEFYTDTDIDVEYEIKHKITNNEQSGAVNIIIQQDEIIHNEQADISQGIATLSIPPLEPGKYDIICTYDNGTSITTVENTLNIKKHDITGNLIIDEGPHNRILNLNGIFTSTNQQTINDEIIDIYIDDNKICESKIVDGEINERLEYQPLASTIHHVTVSNRKDSTYSVFSVSKPFYTDNIDTYITLNHKNIQEDIENDFLITIKENEVQNVISGNVTILIDNDIIADNQPLINGTYAFTKSFKKGQYSVFVYYHDTDNQYNNSTQTFLINVDIFPIKIQDLNDIELDIGQTKLIKNNVVDISNRQVSKGYFNIYIDDIQIVRNVATKVGQLIYELELPNHIDAGEHQLKFEYIDRTNTYLDTDIYIKLIVNKIATSIQIGHGVLHPNQDGYIPFTVMSNYGIVNTGTLTMEIEDEYGNIKTYITPVSNNIVRQIDFTVPNLPSGEHDLTVTYQDSNGNYKDSILNTTIVIDKNEVIIEPDYNSYYPQKEFVFTANIFNQSNKRVDYGYVDIYIDNVKEEEHINVVNGQISTRMLFNTAKTYKIELIYYGGDYYETTSYSYDFVVDRINLNDITYEFDEANKKITEIYFDALDNYDVNDGILYLYIDDIQMGVYNVNEGHKYIDLDVQYLTQGDHNIHFNYIASSIFNDFNNYDNPKIITIQPLPTTLKINDKNIQTTTTNNIDINCDINTNGTIKFYISKYEEEDYKLIGLTNAIGTFTFNYQLTQNITAGKYRIKAQFEGNQYYSDAVADDCVLTVVQLEEPITVDSTDAYYQDSIEITITTEIPNALVHLALCEYDESNEENPLQIIKHIDSIVVNEIERISYPLNSSLIGTYKILVEYDGSPLYAPTSNNCTFTVLPYTPEIDTTTYNIGIGEKLLLSNKVSHNGKIIHTGVLKYYIDDDVFEFEPNIKEKIPMAIMEDKTIQVEYVSEDTDKILNTEDSIDVKVFPNDIYLDIIEAPKYIDYKEQFEIKVKILSNTTLPIDVDISVQDYQDGNVIFSKQEKDTFYRIATIPCKVPTEASEYTIYISTQPNNHFRTSEIHYIAKLNQQNYVSVSDTEGMSNVETLEDAIELVQNNGIIDINKNIEETTTISLDKNLTINGNNNSLKNITINNNADVIINDVRFEKAQINNNGQTNINNCVFTNNTSTIISNRNNMELNNCCFINNDIERNSCIKIENPNIHTVINKCTFNGNSGELYGICVYSNRVNELEIKDTKFINNKSQTSGNACIYAYGNSAFYKNIFYNNEVDYEIKAIKSEIIADKNIFHRDNADTYIPISFELNSIGDIDLNYWNNAQTREEIDMPENIQINNWLIGSLIKEDKTVTPQITQYVNMLEKEKTNISIEYDSFNIEKCDEDEVT